MSFSKGVLIRLIMLLFLFVAMPAVADDKEEADEKEDSKGNLVLFIGMDISGSFKNRQYFDDSIKFAAHYLYAHLRGIGGLKVPKALFVGSIGGASVNEAKTFFPIQTFQYKSIEDIEKELRKIFPTKTTNKFTDFNAYFDQVATFMRNRKLVMKPTDIVLFSDGIPDAPTPNGTTNYKMLDLKPLENLSRKITVRVLYTSAVTGAAWQSEVPRKRVRVWTQDDQVMAQWKSPDIFLKDVPFEKQDRFFKWIQENVDFPIRVKKVN